MIELSDEDHDQLTALIYTILDAVAGRQITRADAMSALAHVITAAAIDNESEVRGWLVEPDTVAGWIRRCQKYPQERVAMRHLFHPRCGIDPVSTRWWSLSARNKQQ
jgi:hypothetical protein